MKRKISRSPGKDSRRHNFHPKLLLHYMKDYFLIHHNSVPADIAYFVFFCHLLHFLWQFLNALYWIDYQKAPLLPPLLWVFISAILYIFSTKYEIYNFHNTRITLTIALLFHAWLLIVVYAFRLLSRLSLPVVMNLNTDDIFTKDMVLLLARALTELPLLPIGYFLYKGIFYILKNENSRMRILSFKITHYLRPKDQDIVYDLKIVKDIRTGKYVPIYQKDRFLHVLVDGTSGTGKTSSTILPAIKDDLNMRCKAEDIQVKLLREMKKAGNIAYAPNGTAFSVNQFIPTPEKEFSVEEKAAIENRLDEIRINYPVCGITALAPDDSLTDDICRLCDARDIPYNRIDATRGKNGKRKKNWTGMNPFYIPNDMDEDRKNELIVKKAVIFSDVMQCITDLKGKADSYFTNLNRQMIANIAILVMVTVPALKKRYASPADLQLLMNNFDLFPEYVDKLEELDRKENRYTFIIQYIRQDILGFGRTKMEDQSRGTRNIINEFLIMPANKEVFCSQDSIDFDRALANGEITVCNYNLAAGDSDAIAFGLFFLLSMNNAVLSRPGSEKNRTPHFFYIDELPVLIHPSLEKNFVLFRKFGVGMFVAIQTLDQMEKNEVTRYMKGVILGCAHAIIFGRSSLSDMEIFSALAGVHDEVEEQQMTSETSLSQDDPHLSYSSRESVTKKNVLEEIDIRLKDFQEVTFFTTQNGRPLPVIQGKVSFLQEQDWEEQTREYNPWAFTRHQMPSAGSPDAQDKTDFAFSKLHLDQGTYVGYLKKGQSDTPSQPEPSSPALPETNPDIPEGSESLDGLL